MDHPACAAWLAEPPRGDVSAAPGGSEPTRAEMLQAQLRKRKADAATLEAKLEILRSRLVPRETVRVHVIGFLDGLCKRLLTDVPRTAGLKCETAARTGGDRIALEKVIRTEISGALQSVKRTTTRKLQTIAATANPPPVAESEDQAAEHDTSLVRATGHAATERLEEAAATMVDRLFRSVARESCPDGRYDAKVFETTLASLDALRSDAESQLRVMMGAAVQHAVDAALRPAEPGASAK